MAICLLLSRRYNPHLHPDAGPAKRSNVPFGRVYQRRKENKEQEQEKRGWVGRKMREEKKEKKKKNLPNTGIGQHGVKAKNLLESVFLNGWCMCVCLCYVSFYLPF